jgi:RNA polymerase sigma-70 factor (ECF subfamily)
LRNIKNIESQLVSQLRNGETKAFEELYLRYSRKLFVFTNNYLKSNDEAEEIVQDVFVNI